MTDEELVAKIEQTVQDLNTLLRKAEKAGIQFDASIEKLDVQRLKDTDPVFFTEVFIGHFHRIHWLSR